MLGALPTDLTLKDNNGEDNVDAAVSQGILTEPVDEEITASKMQTESMKDDNVTDTQDTTQHDDNSQLDTSVVHMSRP